jgi:hypothetical protein
VTKILTALSGMQALVLAVVVVGCATAAVIAGVISSSDFLAILTGTGVLGGTVATAHIVGTQVNTAAGSGQPAAAPQPAPVAAQPVVPLGATNPANPGSGVIQGVQG